MALTGITTNNNVKKQAWEEKLFREVLISSYFSKFMSSSPESIIQVKTALESKKGDSIRFTLIPRLTGSGVTTGETLEGKEENLNTYTFDVTLERHRHAVRHDYISDKRAFFSISDEGAFALRNWGSEKIDKLVFDMLTGVDHTRVFYTTDGSTPATTATASTAKTSLTTSSVIFPKLIQYAKTWASTGGNRAQSPIRPVMVNGKSHYVLLVHPDVGYDLKSDATYAQAQREAKNRGDENNIFTGALGIWDNVVVHEHERVPIGTDGGAGTVPWAECLLLGAQAGVWGWGQRPNMVSKDFDYEEETGQAWRMTDGQARSKFNSKDFGVCGFYVARTQVSDAA